MSSISNDSLIIDYINNIMLLLIETNVIINHRKSIAILQSSQSLRKNHQFRVVAYRRWGISLWDVDYSQYHPSTWEILHGLALDRMVEQKKRANRNSPKSPHRNKITAQEQNRKTTERWNIKSNNYFLMILYFQVHKKSHPLPTSDHLQFPY